MTDSVLTNIWIIAFAFLVLFPFNIYDLYKKKDRTLIDYVEPVIIVVIIIIFLGCMIF